MQYSLCQLYSRLQWLKIVASFRGVQKRASEYELLKLRIQMAKRVCRYEVDWWERSTGMTWQDTRCSRTMTTCVWRKERNEKRRPL